LQRAIPPIDASQPAFYGRAYIDCTAISFAANSLLHAFLSFVYVRRFVMEGKSVPPFDLYCANLSSALRMLEFNHQARQQACKLEMERILRDMEAAHAIQHCLSAAHDWSEFAASFQTVVRDYIAATMNLWQQGLGSAARLQGGLSEGLHEALATWSASLWQWPTHAPLSQAVLPWQAWPRPAESAAADHVSARASRSDATSRIAPVNAPNSVKSPASDGHDQEGDHHVD
jgi:hypothetical protein